MCITLRRKSPARAVRVFYLSYLFMLSENRFQNKRETFSLLGKKLWGGA
jgi:hypothetical protein